MLRSSHTLKSLTSTKIKKIPHHKQMSTTPIPPPSTPTSIILVDTPTQVNPTTFYYCFDQWTRKSQYKQIHKIEIDKKLYAGEVIDEAVNVSVETEEDGVLFDYGDLETNSLEIYEDEVLAEKVAFVRFDRHLYPTDYKRKNEVFDRVYHYFGEDPKICMCNDYERDEIPNYYLPVKEISFELTQLEDNELDDLNIVSPEDMVERVREERSKYPKKKKGRTSNKKKIDKFKLLKEGEIYPLYDAPFEYKFKATAKVWRDEDVSKLKNVTLSFFENLRKWSKTYEEGGYEFRYSHSTVVDLDTFTENYRRLKETYGYWVGEWKEVTDPQKYVFEDVAIAAFLISIWEKEQNDYGIPKQTFIDLGAGNGFLVYLLTMEGYTGRGVDLIKRKIWDRYPENVILQEEAILPEEIVYEEDWLIANHSDELTPWIPLIASRKTPVSQNGHLLGQRFFILPCCEWDFDKRFTKRAPGKSRYLTYLDYIQSIGELSGYNMEKEHIKIPSTRNCAFVGRTRSMDITESQNLEIIERNHQQLFETSKYSTFVPKFRAHH